MAELVHESKQAVRTEGFLKPSIGRIVILKNNLVDRPARRRCGIVTHVNDDGSINIRVFNEDASGEERHIFVKHMSDDPAYEAWDWPERV